MNNSYSHLTKAPAYNQISCFSRIFNRLVILPLTLPLCLVLVLGVGNVWGQQVIGSYPGMNGGFEGATIENTVFSSAQSGKWVKNNATQTIGSEITTVRSGSTSLSATNSSTGRRIWSPLVTVSSFTSSVTIQYYRRVSNTTNTQQSQSGIGNGTTGTESQSGTYSVPSAANTWEKVTYTRSSNTYTDLAGVVYTRQTGTGGTMFIDDLVMYNGSVDNTAPNSPGAVTVSNPTISSLDISWGAASGGVDGGGYVVVRYSSNPNADNDPNQNGIYAVGNTTTNGTGSLTGTIRYIGTGASFTDNVGLSSGTQYWYKVYTVDKAFNYSAESSGNGTTTSPTPSITLADNGSQVSASSVAAGATNVILHQSSLAVTTANATLTGVSFTTAGTYAAADVSNFKVWYSADNSFATTGDNTQLGSTITTSLGAGAKSVSSLSQAINSGSTGYIFITTDIAASPTGGDTINVSALTTSDISFSSGSKSGSTTAGGAKTLQSAASPTLNAGTISGSFGNICINSTSSAQSFTLSGSNLNGTDVSVSSTSTRYTFATLGGSYSNPLTLTAYNGSSPGTIYVKFAPTAAGADNANISIAGGGASAATVSQSSNSGVNTVPTVTTPTTASLSATTVTLGGTISSIGCSNATTTGIYYSTSNGFADGAGTAVSTSSLNISSTPNVFTQAVTGLTANTQYYFKAFATNSGGNGYSSQGSFITFPTAPAGLSTGSITYSGFTVSWTDLAGTLEFYEVQIFSDAGFSTQVGSTYTTAANASSQAISGLSASTNYYYRVRAVNNTNQASSYSTGGPVTTSVGPCETENFDGITWATNSYVNNSLSKSSGDIVYACVNCLRQTAATQNSENATNNASSNAVRLEDNANTQFTATISNGGAGDFSVYLRRWDNDPDPDYTVEYSINNGTNYTNVITINNAWFGSSAYKQLTFSINANSTSAVSTDNIIVRIKRNGGERIMIDDVSWTCYSAPEINLKQSSTNLVSGSDSFSLGTVTTGSSSSATTFTIENTGTATLNITGTPKVAISGHTSDFTIDQTSTSATVSASDSTTFTVTFSPTTTGARSATISIANDDSNENPYTFTVTGTGATYAPSVTTSAATSISTTGATLNGEVTSDGGATVTERGFVYKTSSSVTISDNKTVVAGTTGTFSLSPTSLSVNTQYYFRAYAINSVDTTLGSELNFWTLANAPTAPTVNTPTGSSLNVTIGASDGNPSTTTYAIQETTSGNYVQANGTLGASAVWQTATTWSAITVILSSATTYTFQVKARNGANTETAFGSTTSGTTSSIGLNSVILSSALTSTYGTASTGVSFTASGSNLTSNITATAQSGYQVSTDNSSFGASVSVASGTTVYVGFASTLSAGNYNNQIAVVLSGGGAAGNANVTTSSSSNMVSQKALSITTATIASKVYDGTTTSGTVTAGTLSGFIGSDTVVVASANGTYSDANGGTGKTATITYTLGNGTNGGLATNYSLANTSATGNITQATQTITFSSFTTPITASTTIVASSNFGGAITYSSSNTNVATINSSTGVVTIAGNGTTTITASNSGNSNYTAASTSQVLTVNSSTVVTLLTWNTFGNAGTETTESSTSNTNVASSTLSLGAGVTAASNSNRFGGSNWFKTGNTNPSLLSEAITANSYIEFIVTPTTGYSITPTSFEFIWDFSGSGPSSVALRSSADNYATNLGTVTGMTESTSLFKTLSIAGLSNITSATTFRLYGYAATGTGGTGGFDCASSQNNVLLKGTVFCTTPSQSSAISGTTTVCSGAAQTYSVTNVSGVGYNWVLPGGWSGSSTSNSISATVGSSGGNISVTPYNSATGCTNYAGSAQSVAVSVNASPTAPAATITQPTCSTATGTITITSQSDVEYSINGTDYQVSNVFSGLSPDTYTIYVKSTTTGNCVASTGSQVVTQPTIPTAPAASITQPTCSVATGTITITSQSNVEYSINGTDYQVSNVFSGLSPNTYTIYVESTTTGNCVASTGSQVVNAQPATPSAPTAGSVTQPTCSVTTGTFQINSYDPARTYSFTPSSGYIISGTGLVTALANSYTFTVDNAAGCTSPASSSQVVNAQPTIPTAPSATITQPTCSVATGTITITSQSNVEYSVDGSTYQVSNVFSGLSPNTYTIYVKSTTTGNCVASTGSQVVNAQPSVPTAPTASAQSLCSGSTVADLTVTSGSSIQWYDASTNGNLLAGGTSLTAGTYYASQTVSGCESTTRTSVAVTINSTGTWIGGASGNWNVAGNWCGGVPDQNTEVANIPSGVTVTVNNSPTILTYTLASGSTVNLGNNVITIAAGGSFTNNGTFNAGTGTVAYAGAGTLDGSATTFNNLTVSGPLTVNTSPTINGILTINNGGSIITNPITYGPSATLVYNQGGAVSSTNYEWPTVNLPTNVTIQNASNVTINESKNINGILTLTSGDLILGANILTLGASASISSASSSSHIDATSSGEVRKIYNANGSFTFPVGDGTNYTPATLNFTAGTSITGATDDYVGVRLKTSKVTGMNNTNQHYIKRAWFIEPGAGLSSYTYSVELSYCFADIEGTESEIRPVKRSFENSAYVWYYPGDVSFTDGIRLTGTTSAINTTTKVLLWSGLTSFSEFGGAGQGGLLPVELLFFNANAIENKVKLNWATSLEINNEKFEIERSADAVSFTKIATVSGGGNTTSLQDYAAFDEQPLSGWSYYRLKQIDFDQAFEYSNIASVYFEEGEFAIAVYPNPAKNSIMIQTFGDTKIYDAAIYNSLGQEIRKAEFNINMSIEDLASGTYTIKVIAGEKIIVKQIVKQ